MAGAVWYFELRDQRDFESTDTALFDGGERAATAEAWLRAQQVVPASSPRTNKATVVHVYRADCPCNRFTGPHLEKIKARYAHEGVRFLAREVDSELDKDLPFIDATPAAMVFDGHGRLMYYGPYSNSAECGTSGGFVERVLDRVLGGRSQTPERIIGGGCFCSVKSKS